MAGLPRLLVVGDGVVPTGFSRVVYNILRHLPRDSYEIHHLAVNYTGDPHDLSWKVYPAGKGGGQYGFQRLRHFMEALKPSLVFTCGDLWIQEKYFEILLPFKGRTRIVSYSPVESTGLSPDWTRNIAVADRFVVFSEFAKEETLRSLEAAAYDLLEVIPHGVDTSAFYPLPVKYAKQRLNVFADEELRDSFLVLNAHRNQPRKRIDVAIEGFSLFARDKPKNVKLYLHMGIEDLGWNVVSLCKRFCVADRLVMTECDTRAPQNLYDQDLNTIYNAADVGVNTALCEGWGLPNFEHAAARKAQLVPDIPSLRSIWFESPEYMTPSSRFICERTLYDGYLISPETVAAGLERLYQDRDFREAVAERCYAHVTAPAYSWSAIGARWDALFREVLET
jgi:glycosyltransferase involved in cell wall biosynthesis